MSLQEFLAVTDVKVRPAGASGRPQIGAPTHNEPLDHSARAPSTALPPLLQTVTAAAFQHAALPLASQLLFSSTSAVWSQSGSAHYAAANAYLDGHAVASQSAGLPSTAVQYGPFAGAGMAAAHVEGMAALGLKSLLPEQVS